MDEIIYKGCTIDSTPFQLQGGEWSTDIWIHIHRAEETASRNFNTEDTFSTREEAVAHCLQFGMDIIDGKVEGRTVEDL